MFAQQSSVTSRKRDRESDEEDGPSGFGLHRSKRHVTNLPIRQSPKSERGSLFSLQTYIIPPQGPNPFPNTITPVDSDSEDMAASINKGIYVEPKSCFSPWSSPVTRNPLNSQPPPCPGISATHTDDTPIDDLEMMDSDPNHLSPGIFHPDQPNSSISGRIPTPIHSQFSTHARWNPANNTRLPTYAEDGSSSMDHSKSYNTREDPRQFRRLPSPISEGENSPSVALQGFGEMQMDMGEDSYSDNYAFSGSSDESKRGFSGSSQELRGESPPTQLPFKLPEILPSPPKKGHCRSKHSLRNWGGVALDTNTSVAAGVSVTKFSMGYRADCEKCRMKVPGHFSHIITRSTTN